MRHAHARIAGGDINIGFITGIPPDESKPIDWLHDLPRPAIIDLCDHRKSSPGPLLQSLVAVLSIIRLPCFVIFAPDDQDIMALRVRSLLDSDVMVRIRLIPVQ